MIGGIMARTVLDYTINFISIGIAGVSSRIFSEGYPAIFLVFGGDNLVNKTDETLPKTGVV